MVNRVAVLWDQLALRRTWPVPAAALALTAIGVVSIAAVGGPAGKQAQFLVLAFAAMAVFQLVHYKSLLALAWPIYLLGLAGVAYTVLDDFVNVPLVTPVNGARNWIQLPGFSVQPAELVKAGFVMVLAGHLRFRESQRTLAGLVVPVMFAVGPVLLILKQPDLGTALVFFPTLAAMLFAAGAKVRHFALAAGALALLLPPLWLAGLDVPVFRHLPAVVKEYQRDRVVAMFRDDERTRQGTGFQQQWAGAAIGTGGLFGKGLGEVPAGRVVPEAHNDMIFALVGEQFGLAGAAGVIGLYGLLCGTGLVIALGTREPFGRLVAVGVTALIATQAMLNLAVALRVMPVTGVTLPYVSYGGSSLIVSYMLAGLLLNVGQHRPWTVTRESFDFDGQD